MAGTLYLVPTPIGNLGDISRRMAETLELADFIAAEDTRVTVKLLNHLGLKKPMTAYHRHNCDAAGPAILRRIEAGEGCALVTDAGTPAVSDPGEELVSRCGEAGIPVCAIPGPCALVTALAVSGQPTGRFTFEGFLAMNKKNRRAHLESLQGEERTMIFYEAPHKLKATLADLAERISISPYYLSRKFTEHMKCNLNEYVNQIRVSSAVTALKGTDKTITEICYECGFDNIRSFNRAFKAITGETPTQYRKREDE